MGFPLDTVPPPGGEIPPNPEEDNNHMTLFTRAKSIVEYLRAAGAMAPSRIMLFQRGECIDLSEDGYGTLWYWFNDGNADNPCPMKLTYLDMLLNLKG